MPLASPAPRVRNIRALVNMSWRRNKQSLSFAMVTLPTSVERGPVVTMSLSPTARHARSTNVRDPALEAGADHHELPPCPAWGPPQREDEPLPHFASGPLVGIMNRDWTRADLLTRRADDPDCEDVACTGRPCQVGKQVAKRSLVTKERSRVRIPHSAPFLRLRVEPKWRNW